MTKDVWLTAKVQYEKKKTLCLWGFSNVCPFLINTKKYKFACRNRHSICQSLWHKNDFFFSFPFKPTLFNPSSSSSNNWLYLSFSQQHEHAQQSCSDPADLSLPWWLERCLLHHSPPLHPHHPLPCHTGFPLRAAGLRMLHQDQNCSWPAPPTRGGGLGVTMVTAGMVSKGTTTVDWWKRLQIWTELVARMESFQNTPDMYRDRSTLLPFAPTAIALMSWWLKILNEIYNRKRRKYLLVCARHLFLCI